MALSQLIPGQFYGLGLVILLQYPEQECFLLESVENGEQVDKFVTEEFLVGVVYGCQVVVTNPTHLDSGHDTGQAAFDVNWSDVIPTGMTYKATTLGCTGTGCTTDDGAPADLKAHWRLADGTCFCAM